ncbi:MAG: hypothetical protein NTZ69_05890 [Bacteroidia bacterium]|nr:hypothetical protein [Bacteroidia bacterium]
MKRGVVLLILVIALQSIVYSQKPRLNGVLKFSWGMSVEQVDKLIDPNAKSNAMILYGMHDVNIKSFAGHGLEKTTFYFNKDQFYCADFEINDYRSAFERGEGENFNQIKSEISEKYFPPDSIKFRYCKWIFSDDNYIILQEGSFTNTLSLIYCNKFLLDIYDKEKKNSELEFKKNKLKDY